MFTLLTFMLRYSLYRTKPNIITLIALPSLTDFGRFLISDVFSWIRIFTYIISATMNSNIFSGGFFSMADFACRYMWLFSLLWKISQLFLSFESFHRFRLLTTESPKMTVTLSCFFACWSVFLWQLITEFVDYFLVSALFLLPELVFLDSICFVGFAWLDRRRWFFIIPGITIVFNIMIL